MSPALRRSDGVVSGASEKPRRPRADEVRFRKEAGRLREEAARCRNGASRALVDYYSFLRSVEVGGMWQRWGYPRFDDVVRSVEADLAEYRSFLKCLDAIGSEDTLREIGMEAADVVSNIPSSVNSRTDETVNARDAAVAEVLALARRHGTTPSRQMVWEIRRKHYKREAAEESPAARYLRRIKELEADKRRLEAKVQKLERENAELRERCDAVPIPGSARSPSRRPPVAARTGRGRSGMVARA